MTVRAIADEDWRGLCHLLDQPGVRFGTLRMPFHKPESIRQMVESRPADGLSLVKDIDGLIGGCLFLYRHAGRRSHVADFWMAVSDDFLRQGIGTELLRSMLDSADNWMGIKRIELTVYCDNAAAIELYASHGFKTEGTHRCYAYRAGDYADAFAMARLMIG